MAADRVTVGKDLPSTWPKKTPFSQHGRRSISIVVLLLLSFLSSNSALLDAGRVTRPRERASSFSIERGLTEFILPKRDVRVWLPPDYEGSMKNHPVLYCHDGQHVIADDESSFPPPRSWRLGSTLTDLIMSGEIARSPIVVLVDNCHRDGKNILGDVDMPVLGQPLFRRRWLEYGDGPLGERYIDWLCDELKPAIDAEFRTLSEPQHTYAMGSSMGGLCAFNSMWRRPDVVGHAACLSPCFQAPLLAQVAMEAGKRLNDSPLIYIDNGGDTDSVKVSPMPSSLTDGINAGWWWLDTGLQPGVDAMCLALRMQGIDFKYHREPGGRHNEAAWASRLHIPLLHLFGEGRKNTEQDMAPTVENASYQ